MFAKAYDLLMADVDYEQLYQFLKPYLKENDSIVDAGCGSGYLLLELIKNNHDVIGIDIDSSMLALAKDKLTSHNLHAALYEHDLREPLPIKVDVVLMMFDVINYFKGAKKIFKNIFQSLNAGGRLIFDFYKEEVLDMYHDYVEEDDEPFSYTWRIQTVGSNMVHQLKTPFGIDHVKQYIYTKDYYLDILKQLGFTYEIFDGLDERKHYVIAYKK
jgi:SAM-dependent methyltransferase